MPINKELVKLVGSRYGGGNCIDTEPYGFRGIPDESLVDTYPTITDLLDSTLAFAAEVKERLKSYKKGHESGRYSNPISTKTQKEKQMPKRYNGPTLVEILDEIDRDIAKLDRDEKRAKRKGKK